MCLDPDDGEDHAGEVAVGVADENAGGIPIVFEQGEGDAEEGEEQVDAGEVRGLSWREGGIVGVTGCWEVACFG